MPEPAAASVATTLATSEPAASAAAAAPATVVDAAATEAARVAALTPEAKAAEETAKTAADAETKRVAALTPEARKAEVDAKAKTDAEARAKAVPEKYELKLPEGQTLDKEVTGEFEKTAKELGLSQEAAQKLYDLGAKATQKATAGILTQVETLQASWLVTTKADPEFGGEKLEQNLAVAKSAMQFATPELKALLNETKLGNHPEVIRWMFRVGKAMAEDKFVPGGKKGEPAVGADRNEVLAARIFKPQT